MYALCTSETPPRFCIPDMKFKFFSVDEGNRDFGKAPHAEVLIELLQRLVHVQSRKQTNKPAEKTAWIT